MAKANLVLPNGTNVAIEGEAEEVAALLAKFAAPATQKGPVKSSSSSRKAGRPSSAKSRPKGPMGYVRDLIGEGFFKATKRSASDVQEKLEERGLIYQNDAVAVALLRLVKTRELRRVKDKGKKIWLYVMN